MEILGIDIGGSGIKGALVDTDRGAMATERIRIPTPQPATPTAVIGVVKELVSQFNYDGPIGVGFPSVVIHGTVLSAANVDDSWINFDLQTAVADMTGNIVAVINDADAAGVAEMRFGAGCGHHGAVMIFTLGTGIGSSMFVDGQMIPNLELGHIYLPGHTSDAEYYASDRIRKAEGLKWKAWGARLTEYFAYVESLFSPDLIIIGGGVSKKHEKFLKHIRIQTPIAPAQLLNEAGIIGAATAVGEN